MEVKCEAKVYMVIQKCDKCGKGKMETYGSVDFSTSPPTYPHKCDNCGYEESYHVAYPYQTMEYLFP